MNASPLIAEDLDLFLLANKEAAVRIFKKNKWFIGLFRYMSFESDCMLRVEPLIRCAPSATIDCPQPHDMLSPITESDISEFSENALPFKLINPEKIGFEEASADTIVISFTDGIALLSKRDDDIRHVQRLIVERR